MYDPPPGSAPGYQFAHQLIAIGRLWRQLQQMIRLLVGEKVDEANLREPTRRHLAQSGGADNFDALKELIMKRAAAVHAAYHQIIGPEQENRHARPRS